MNLSIVLWALFIATVLHIIYLVARIRLVVGLSRLSDDEKRELLEYLRMQRVAALCDQLANKLRR
jgi:putative exporter of polyketide antibiotics